ncbi:MAG: hypothetical protein J1E02_07260 [Coprobacter sp.]|nr:hypothetical protein [Coprobacter sp.]
MNNNRLNNIPSFPSLEIGPLIFLLGTSILPSSSNDKFEMVVIIGGLFLLIAFVEFAENNARGVPTKLVYTIARYFIASILFIITGIQLYLYYANSIIHLSPYALVVDIALIAYLLAFKPSNTTIGKKILKIIGYTLVFVAINALQKVRTKTISYYYPYSSEEIDWGMFVFICIIMFVGVICIRIGGKSKKYAPNDTSMVKKHTPVKNINKEKTNIKRKKTSIKRILINIALSLSLLAYVCFSLLFMAEEEVLTVCGVIFYIPCCGIIVIYYLWLIWNKEKITGAQILLLPLLQKVNKFKAYRDNPKDKKELVKTIMPFLLSMVICPMLTTILFISFSGYNRHSQQEWLIMILLIPPLILVISFFKRFVQDWVTQSSHSETEK